MNETKTIENDREPEKDRLPPLNDNPGRIMIRLEMAYRLLGLAPRFARRAAIADAGQFFRGISHVSHMTDE